METVFKDYLGIPRNLIPWFPSIERKMYKEALAEAGCDFDAQIFPIDLRNIPTEEAMQKIKTFVEEVNSRT